MKTHSMHFQYLIRGTIVALGVLVGVGICQADFIVHSIVSDIEIGGEAHANEWNSDPSGSPVYYYHDFDSFGDTALSGALSGYASAGGTDGNPFLWQVESGAAASLGWTIDSLAFTLNSITSAYSSDPQQGGSSRAGADSYAFADSSGSFFMLFELTTPYWAEVEGELNNMHAWSGSGGQTFQISGGAYGTYDLNAAFDSDASFTDSRLLLPGLYTIALDLGSSSPADGGYHEGSAVFSLNLAPVPEPSSLVLLGMGITALVGVYRRRPTSM